MKTLKFSISTRFIAIIAIFFFSFSCQKNLKPYQVDPAFSAYVISFTSGVVSNTTNIQVRLVQQIAEAVPGKELSVNPFSFSPGISGKAKWLDKQTIQFIPDKKLESGKIYEAEFKVDKFVEVPTNLRTLKFRFQIMKQYISYEFNGIEPVNEGDMKLQKVHGSFLTADVADNKDMEALVSFSENAGSNIRWSHSKDGRLHNFTLENVERKESPYTIKIEWNGKKIDAKRVKNEQFQNIHAITIFCRGGEVSPPRSNFPLCEMYKVG